jgi:hypothetical protein
VLETDGLGHGVCWVKRGSLGSQVWMFGAGGTSNPREFGLNFDSNNKLDVASNNWYYSYLAI